jgi:hypothetical protein
MSPEPSIEAEASPLPPKEARAKPAPRMQSRIDAVLDFYDRSGLSAKPIERTKKRQAAIGGRLKYDGCTVEHLTAAIEGAVRALEDDVLDHPRWTTDIGRITLDVEHVQAFIDYAVSGDPDVLSEMLAGEMPKEATA